MSKRTTVKIENIVGTMGVSEALGIGYNNITGFLRDHIDFPEPIAVINKKTRLWDMADVLPWIQARDGQKAASKQAQIAILEEQLKRLRGE